MLKIRINTIKIKYYILLWEQDAGSSSLPTPTILGRQLGEQAGVHLFLRAPPLNRGLLSFLHQFILSRIRLDIHICTKKERKCTEAGPFFVEHYQKRGRPAPLFDHIS